MLPAVAYARQTSMATGNRVLLGLLVVGVIVAFQRNLIPDTSLELTLINQQQPSYPSHIEPVTFKSSARACPKVQVNPANLKSQYGEDKQLLQWFGGVCDGTYLEMGALDGVSFSNTYVFNKELGWRGVLIELANTNFAHLNQNRPNEIANIHAGVCDERRLLHYVDGQFAVGGIWEYAPKTFRDQWWNGLTLESPEVHEFECAPLADLLKPHVGESFFFDLFSLDVEGAEFDVLKAIDFTKIGFGIIMAEADTHNPLKNLSLRMFLEKKGYNFLMEQTNSYWFVNKDFSDIYGDKIRVTPTS